MNLMIPIISLLIAVTVLFLVLRSSLSKTMQDIPNQRSLHSRPVPRMGGIGLLAGTLAGWTLLWSDLVWWVWLPVLGLFALSVLDDLRGLPVRQRLVAHLVAAALLVGGAGVATQVSWLFAIVVFFFVVWMTNLYNFMDGSDGLAGGMALFGFAAYSVAALQAQDAVLVGCCLAISAAALGFLFFNFHPAKVFMGDAGSIPLGFLAAALGLWGWLRGDWSVWFPLIVFSPFIVDATVTLLKRVFRGEKITEAHREHYYQRAVQMGGGHRRVALVEYGLMILVGSVALWVRQMAFPWQALLFCMALYGGSMWMIDVRWKRLQSRVS